jgi:heme exporter protein CcmB
MTAIQRALAIAGREFRAERRQSEGTVAALTLIGLLVLLESLVIGPGVARDPGIAAALFWIAIAFAAILATARSFDRELEEDAVDALLALPGGRDAIYAGKTMALAGLLLPVAGAGALLSAALLDLTIALPLHALVAIACGVVSLPPVVVLVTALTLRLRARALAVPLVTLPLLLAQLLGATQASTAALSGDGTAAIAWCAALLAIALVEGALGLTIVAAAIE